jgi:hypothetical protein
MSVSKEPERSDCEQTVARRVAMVGMGRASVVELRSGSVILLHVRFERGCMLRAVDLHQKGFVHHYRSRAAQAGEFFDFRGFLKDPDWMLRRVVLTPGDRVEVKRFPAFGSAALEVEASADAHFSGWGS